MESTVKSGVKEGNYFIVMDEKVNGLRKKIWSAIHEERGDLSDCDVAMALGIVQYELIHHSDETKKS